MKIRNNRNGSLIYEDASPSMRQTVQNALTKYINLAHAYLLNADLDGIRADGAIFNCAKLNGASLNGAVLKGANFVDACLDNADLTGADFTDANFTDADLVHTNLTDTNFTRATLLRANVTDAIFDETDMTDVYCLGIRSNNPIFTTVQNKAVQVPSRGRHTSSTTNPHQYCTYAGLCIPNDLDPHTPSCNPPQSPSYKS